ncbi:hypothetical protein EAT49_15900 [Histidinibacterium lentulum]|uniref:Uncharacterized protein n=2 Tax=Histidinibacterium lentulum TaxID=2480588 RepID=A0A3N2QV69_9RHOB|nr:hypothetical protein EAT49_15900 [Histidinibacterium lentulum]
MGKTATTSLQVHVFPRLAAHEAVGAYNPQTLHLGLDAAVNGHGDEARLIPLAAAQECMLISNETLLEWDPVLWEPSADRLLRVFGGEVTILITLRDPASYLRSLFQQMLHHNKVRPPEDFLLPADVYRGVRRFVRPGELDAIDVDAFDMVYMASLYAERFASVVLVPFEEIGTLRFLSAIWTIPDDFRDALARDFVAAPRVNTSYSAAAVRLTLGRERALAALGLRSRSASDRQLRKTLSHMRGTPFTPDRSPLPSWHRLMGLLSRYGPKAAYRLPNGAYLGRHMARNAAFYAALRAAPEGYVRLIDGVTPSGLTPAALAQEAGPACS